MSAISTAPANPPNSPASPIAAGPAAPPTSPPGPPRTIQPTPPVPPRPPANRAARGLFTTTATLAAIAVLGILIAALVYSRVAGQLPDPGELTKRASAFRSTHIYYNDGKTLLDETFDADSGRRTVLPLEQIPTNLRQATIATEDRNFYHHPGVDPVALLRAVYYAIIEREIVSGGSTIPQQLVKLVLLTPERSVKRKVKEAILAAEITRRYSKDEILALYLNEVYYGNFAFGAAAAAETYFGKAAADLTLGEAALLAGIPQSPAYHDPYTQPERAKRRQQVVLNLMVENTMITQAEADAAFAEPLKVRPLSFDLKAPHFTLFVREQVEKLLGPEALYRGGLEVVTTLDQKLQEQAETVVREQVQRLAAKHVTNGALVSMRPEDGAVVAFVGSADFYNKEIQGQVNMALAARQPGSALKPFVYLSNFENHDRPAAERWTPGTLLADVRTEFPNGANPPYVPVNYDGQEHGMVTVRTALANSYNVPAVLALQNVGLDYFKEVMRRVGVTTLTRDDYGLSLALGSGEVPLVELTEAYAVLATGGRRQPALAIKRIQNNLGTLLCEVGSPQPCQPGPPGVARQQIVDAVDAFLITDMLSDNPARTPSFGSNSPLKLRRPAAAKTGTTNDYRDNWTMGYTPQLVTGVWVGNADNTPMRSVSGVTGAGPIWNAFMEAAHADLPVQEFQPVPGVRQFEVCADTGTLPSPACPAKTTAWFAEDRPPLGPEHDLHQYVKLDRQTGQLADENTPEDDVEEVYFKVYPPEVRDWAIAHGIPQPPLPPEPGSEGDRPPGYHVARISSPSDGDELDGVIPVRGSADATGFDRYEIQVAPGHQPEEDDYVRVDGPEDQPVDDDSLGRWDTRGVADGPYALRLVVRTDGDDEYSASVYIFVKHALVATATVTPTLAVLPTPLPTPLATPTLAVRPTLAIRPTSPFLPTVRPTNAPLPATAPPGPTVRPTLNLPTSEPPTPSPGETVPPPAPSATPESAEPTATP